MIETPKKRGPGRPPLPFTKRRNVLRVHLTDAEMTEVLAAIGDQTATAWARGVILAVVGLGPIRRPSDRAKSPAAKRLAACSTSPAARAGS